MNIRVDLTTPITDGTEVVFRSPVDCSQITGLIVYHNDDSKEFALADAHGNTVGDIDHLFAENVVVKVILDVTHGMAYVQNADTNAYLEGRFQDLEDKIGKGGSGAADAVLYTPQTLTPEQQAQARENIGMANSSGGGLSDDSLELIAEIELEQEARSVTFDKDVNGEPFELEDFYLEVQAHTSIENDSTINGHVYVYSLGNSKVWCNGTAVGYGKNKELTNSTVRRIFNAGQLLVSTDSPASGSNSSFVGGNSYQISRLPLRRPITGLMIIPSSASVNYLPGASFKLYGRRVMK